MISKRLCITILGVVLLPISPSCKRQPSDAELTALYKCEANLSGALVETIVAEEKLHPSTVAELIDAIPEDVKRCPLCGELYTFNLDRRLWSKHSVAVDGLAVACSCAHTNRAGSTEFIGVKFDNSIVRSPKVLLFDDKFEKPSKNGNRNDKL